MRRLLAALLILAAVPAGAAGYLPLGTPYVGPGDIASGAIVWYGLRAYSAAYASARGAAIDVVRSSDSTTRTITVLPGGALDTGTAGAFCAGTTCVVSKIYDQSGANACSGSVPCNLSQGNSSKRPTLTLSCGLGAVTKPCLTYNGAALQGLVMASGAPTQAQPITYSAVAWRSTVSAQFILSSTNTGISPRFGYTVLTSTFFAAANTTVVATVTDVAWHSLQAVFNGVNGSITADAITTSGDTGALGMTTGLGLGSASNSSTGPLDGAITEAGAWPSAFSPTALAAMNVNQHAYWGF